MRPHLLLAALLVACATNAWAQAPGSKDNTFGGDGHTAADLSAGNRYDEFATSVLIQPDGKRVVVVDRYPYIQLIRFNADGSYDNTFGEGGFSQAAPIRHFGGPNSNAAIQSDGRIVVAGETAWNSTSNTDFGIARWTTSGSLDPSFGTQGVATVDFSTYWDTGEMVRVQSDGKLVVAGEVEINNHPFIGLVRLNTDGSIDGTYGAGGSGKYVNVIDVEPTDMSFTPDGKLMVMCDNNADEWVLVRFGANGIIDTGFGVQGIRAYDVTVGSHSPFVHCMAIQSDGRLLFGGELYNGTNTDMFVTRYTAAGALDGTFHGSGYQTTHIGGSEDVRALAVQPDGKIVAAGQVFYANLPSVFALARYNPNGDLDGTFGVQGTQITGFSGYEGAGGSAVALHGDGDITAAGGVSNGFHGDVAVATYDVQGTRDEDGYPVQRIVAFYADDGATEFRASAVQSDGKLVTAGDIWNGVNFDMVVARFNLDGTPDATFGTGGSKVVSFDALQSGTGDDFATSVGIQPDGKVVVAGQFAGFVAPGYLPVARLNADGTMDATFGNGGFATPDPPGIFEEGNALVVQSDGKIVIAGDVLNGDFDFMLCRLNPDGTLDPSFGTGGFAASDWGYQDIAFGLVLQADGKLVATGNTSQKDSFLGFDFNTARYNANGTLDAGYGNAGHVTTDFGNGFDFAQAIALQSNGGVIVTGGVPINNDFQFGLTRYGPTGTSDFTFGSNGISTLAFNGSDNATGVGFETDGKIIATGYTDYLQGIGGEVDVALSRFSAGGTPDPSFGTGGKVVADFGHEEWGFAMGLHKRRIYVAGNQRVYRPFTATDKFYGLVAAFLTGPPPADELIGGAIDSINALPGVPAGTKNALNAKLAAALSSLPDTSQACNNLNALLNQIKALTGKKLTVAQAAGLITQVQAIMTTLGCTTASGTIVNTTDMGPAGGPATRFALGGNSPNPFVGSTRINYQLPVPSRVSLRIFNVLGEVVATVVDRVESPGFKSVSWDASRMPAGVYFARLKAGDFTAERKLLLVR
jgi:uncharacterized delta-60 repeat protein